MGISERLSINVIRVVQGSFVVFNRFIVGKLFLFCEHLLKYFCTYFSEMKYNVKVKSNIYKNWRVILEELA